MNQLNCVNCNENILEMILSDYRATVYLKEFNHDNNNFEKMSVLFNEFSGWECEHCDEEILDDETFAKLVKLMPSLEDLDNVAFKNCEKRLENSPVFVYLIIIIYQSILYFCSTSNLTTVL